MENKSHALAAGVFVLMMSALVIALAVWLTRDTVVRRVYEISSAEGVTGLQSQAGVRYKGVAVGKVSAIGLDPKAPGRVLVRIAVDDNTPVTASTFATLGFQGVTGLAFIQLDDTGASNVALATDEAQPARIPMRPGLMTRLTEQGASLVTQLEQASGRANQLLATDNQKSLMAAVTSLEQAARQLAELARHADQFLAGNGANNSPGLPQLVQQAAGTFKSMQSTSERLSLSAEAVKFSATEFKKMSARMNEPGGTLDKVGTGLDTMVPQVNRTADEATRSARQLSRLLEMVDDNPQALWLGRGAVPPGPGEPGFVAPPKQ